MLGAGGESSQATLPPPSSLSAPGEISAAQIYPMIEELLRATTAVATGVDKLTNKLDKDPPKEPVKKKATEKRKHAGADPERAG